MEKIQLTALGDFSFHWHAGGSQWILRRGAGGAKVAPIAKAPFVIGRSPDCQLVLPNDPELLKTTSRWHCHIRDHDGRWFLADGNAPENTAGGGRPKPSVSGTWRNGKRLPSPEELGPGDEITAGPWRFKVGERKEATVDIDALLTRIGSAQPRDLSIDAHKAKGKFAQFHELILKLNEAQGVEASLAVLLEFAMRKISGAEVAAVLVDVPGGEPRVRMAWSRASGLLNDFHFSSGLVSGLPTDKAFLLAGNIADATKSQLAADISSGLLVPLTARQERLGILYMDNRSRGTTFTEDDLYLANALASLVSFQIVQERQVFLSRVEQNMSHYFGPDVVQLILEETRAGRPVSPGVRERIATVVFVDLQGFSAFCRDKPPRMVADLLNSYFEIAAECIQRHGGHLDKFIGDGVMGVFGAQPFDPPAGADVNHAAQAVRAAKDLVTAWAKDTKERSPAVLPVRIGVNTGKVLVGNVGCTARMEYSVIGDAVNLASRMEKLALANGIAVTDETWRMTGAEFLFKEGGFEEVKGFGTLRVWRL
ncbi:MAG: FHA domain-containing protein [Elusimicrobia bacterium]|nr:FHA domain-containing protein [Elusimicrobiota bacterium]